MFTKEADAESAVRVKNMVIDEPDNYIGIVTITEDMVTDEKLKTFSKDETAFGALFEKAKIPRSKDAKPKTFERKRETSGKDNAEELENISTALGLGSESDEADDVEEESAQATKGIIDFKK